MLALYLKIAFRNMWKFKTQSLTGIFGLAFGLACFVPRSIGCVMRRRMMVSILMLTAFIVFTRLTNRQARQTIWFRAFWTGNCMTGFLPCRPLPSFLSIKMTARPKGRPMSDCLRFLRTALF